MPTLQPTRGFDWSRIVWTRRPAIVCSYCQHALPDVPLIMSHPNGTAAAFCDDCTATWWGMKE